MSVFQKERHYIHPVPVEAGRASNKNFRTQTTGITTDGTRLRHIEAVSDVINGKYKNAVMVEPPAGAAYLVYGERDDIQQAVAEIKADPDSVLRRVRPVGQSSTGAFYLNKPPPGKIHDELPPERMEEIAGARRMFPNQGSEDYPRDRQQEELRLFKQHQREIATARVGGVHPSSAEGQAAVEQALAPAAPAKSTTLVT